MPLKILKENSDICSYILHHNFNNSLFSNKFLKYLKKADITPVFKKDEKFLKTIDWSVFCRLHQKFMNDVYTIR